MTNPTTTAVSERTTARRELFERLSADYPDLPVTAIINAVTDADRALWLCGYGDLERLTLERACRYNLDAVAEALAAKDEES